MKNTILLSLLLACISLQSCKNEVKNEVETPQTENEKPVTVQCYKSIYENDTIELQVNTLKSGKIVGNMVMKVADTPERVGEIKGEFHGDTLFADYSFIQGSDRNKNFKNPMAFLKRDNGLVLGNGTILITMGKSYFDKTKPIDFDRVKYKFTTVDCISK